MRTIEEDVCQAIVKAENFSKQNTVVNTNYGKTNVYLHGNLIFTHYKEPGFKFIARSSNGLFETDTWHSLNELNVALDIG